MRYGERDIEREFLKLGVLLGERGDKTKRALTAAELFPSGSRTPLIPAPKSAPAAGSAPTKAEFDALVEDVHAVIGALNALMARARG